jgi:hypothetical protein
VTGSYEPDLIQDWITRFGSIEEAEREAKSRPGYRDEIRRIDATILLLQIHPSAGDDERLRDAQAQRRNLVVAALAGDAKNAVQRNPLPTRPTMSAVRLRMVDGESWPKIEKSNAVGLSHRNVNYIRLALKHGDLGWDLERDCLTFGPETRTTANGIVLPAR